MPPEGGAQDDAKSRVFAFIWKENRSSKRRETTKPHSPDALRDDASFPGFRGDGRHIGARAERVNCATHAE